MEDDNPTNRTGAVLQVASFRRVFSLVPSRSRLTSAFDGTTFGLACPASQNEVDLILEARGLLDAVKHTAMK